MVLEAWENSVSPGGISSVVLGYSRLDGGAARVGVITVSLFSDFVGDRRSVEDKYIKRVHCVSYVLISGVCMRRGHIFPYVIFVIIKNIYVFAFVERSCAVSGVSGSSTSDSCRIVRDKPDFG